MIRIRTGITGTPGGPYLSTMYFAGSLQSEADGAAAAVSAFWDAVDAVMTNTANWAVEDVAAVVDAATGQVTNLFTVNGLTGVGAQTGDPNSWATQGLVSWRTGTFVGGREIRGRTFIPGTVEAHNTGGVPTSGFTGPVNTAAAALIADTGSDLEIWSKVNGTTAFVTSRATWNKWAVLRSRRD